MTNIGILWFVQGQEGAAAGPDPWLWFVRPWWARTGRVRRCRNADRRSYDRGHWRWAHQQLWHRVHRRGLSCHLARCNDWRLPEQHLRCHRSRRSAELWREGHELGPRTVGSSDPGPLPTAVACQGAIRAGTVPRATNIHCAD